MENATNSKSQQPLCTSSNNERSTNGDATFEESGWTMYFEDFFANNNEEDQNASLPLEDDHHESSSLVSDATSLIVKNSNNDEQLVRQKTSKKLSFKKRRTKAGLIDDALEDTASSPVNSPKVCDLMNQFNKSTEQKDKMDNSQEERSGSGSQVDEGSDHLRFNGRENDSTELKKKGLCLVPLSMVMNYIG